VEGIVAAVHRKKESPPLTSGLGECSKPVTGSSLSVLGSSPLLAQVLLFSLFF
jgi:hypothetical protein